MQYEMLMMVHNLLSAKGLIKLAIMQKVSEESLKKGSIRQKEQTIP